MCTSLFLNPLIPLKIRANSWFSPLGISTLSTGRRKLTKGSCTRLDNSQTNQQQLNLSVLTSPCHSRVLLTQVDGVCVWFASALESFRWLRFSQHDTSATYIIDFGSFFGWILDCTSLSRKISQGATPVDQATALERAEQIFVMSQNDKDNMKENLAWGTYVLLRNTNTIPVLISVQDALYVRGYCNIPRDVSKVDALDWFHTQIQRIGLSDLKETLYFPQSADSEFWEILPEGSRSRLVQTVQQAPAGSANQVEKTEGFVIFVSSIDYAIVIKTEPG